MKIDYTDKVNNHDVYLKQNAYPICIMFYGNSVTHCIITLHTVMSVRELNTQFSLKQIKIYNKTLRRI